MDIRNGSVGIYYQALTYAGTPLFAENGIQVFQGLSCVSSEKFPHFKTQFGCCYYLAGYVLLMTAIAFFQFLNPDGTVDLEPNGRPVTRSVAGHQLNLMHIVHSDKIRY